MNTATMVRRLDWDTDSALYRLSSPLVVAGQSYEHVVISALHPINGEHGCIALAATSDGHVTSWEPFASSESPNHEDLLTQLGYEVSA